MSWDRTLPNGANDIAVGDNAIRANNDALETALNREHAFATGLAQSGVHQFMVDTTANIAAAAGGWSTGAIAIDTTLRPGYGVWVQFDGAAWIARDVEPIDLSGNPTLPRVNSQSNFTVTQFATWVEVTPTPGTPDTIALNLNLSPLKWATIVGDTEIQVPTNTLSTSGTTITLDLTMDVAGGHTVTFASPGFHAVGGSGAVAVANGASERTLIQMIRNRSDQWVVTVQPNYVAI